MLYILVSVRDRAADIFGTPFCSGSRGQAIRSFSDEVNNASPENILYRHPDDFDLFLMGTFDDAQGVFSILDKPEQLMLGRDAVASRKEGSGEPRQQVPRMAKG